MATVERDRRIQFDFQQVLESDVPESVRQFYPGRFPWCFAHNSEGKDAHVKDITNRCVPAESAAGR